MQMEYSQGACRLPGGNLEANKTLQWGSGRDIPVSCVVFSFFYVFLMNLSLKMPLPFPEAASEM